MIFTEYGTPGYFLTGYFPVHFCNYSSQTGCGEINPGSGIILLEAMRYAVEEINRNDTLLWGAKLDYRIIDTCNNIKRIQRDLKNPIQLRYENLGFIGPSSSGSATIAAPVLFSFGATVISYSATSIDLSDRRLFGNFYRTVPSDDRQALVIAELMEYFNWTYISTVYSHGNYGQRGMEALMVELEKRKICVQTRNLLPKYPNEKDIRKIVAKLHANPNAMVTVLFTNTEDTRKILRGIAELGISSENVTIVSSTAWRPDAGIASGLERAAKGSLILGYADMRVEEFEEYFKTLTLKKNNYKWFREFWEEVFRCETGAHTRKNAKFPQCTGRESLENADLNLEHSSVRAVIAAVHIYACMLRNKVLPKFCRGLTGVHLTRCVSRNNYPYPYYLPRYEIYRSFTAKKTACEDFKYSADFTKDGAIERSIEILNFDGESYRRVGLWRNIGANASNLMIDDSKIIWKISQNNATPISSCTQPCSAGEISTKDMKRPECCIKCKKCSPMNVVQNNTCLPCEWNENPDEERKICLKIPMMQYGMTKSTKTAVFTLCLVLSTADVIVLGVFLFVSKKKGLTLKQVGPRVLTLIGCLLCNASSLPLLSLTTSMTCIQQHLLFWLAMATCYVSLAIEANFLYNIASARKRLETSTAKNRGKLRKMIYFGLIGVHFLLSLIWMIGRPSNVRYHFVSLRARIDVICEIHTADVTIALIPVIANSVAGYFAYRSRKCDVVTKESLNICVISALSFCMWVVFASIFLSRAKSTISEATLKALFSGAIGAVMISWLLSSVVIENTKMMRVHSGSDSEGGM